MPVVDVGEMRVGVLRPNSSVAPSAAHTPA